jgi:hypothetical protein
MSRVSKKTIILSSIAVFVLAAIVAGYFLFMAPKSQEQKLAESTTYEMITGLTAINGVKPASTVISPASQKWWDSLLLFSSNKTLDELDYSKLSKNAEYIAFTNSPGDAYEVYATLGMSTTFIVYNTPEDARAAGRTLAATTPNFVRANLLMLLPDGAKSDLDYAIAQYTNSTLVIEENDLSLDDTAVWQINFADFSTMYTNGEKSEDVKVFETTSLMLGITSEAGWVGTSSDGLNWDGKLLDSATDTVPNPTNIMAYLSSQLGFLLKDGTVGTTVEVTQENQTGVIYQRQSLLTNYMLISNNEEVAGGLADSETGVIDEGKILPASEGILRVETSPNAFFALMMAETSIYAVTDFSNVVFTVKNANGDSTIKLTPIP